MPSFPECIAVRAVRRLGAPFAECLFGDNLAETRESIPLAVADYVAAAQCAQQLQGVPEVSPKLFRQFVVARLRCGRLNIGLRGRRPVGRSNLQSEGVAIQSEGLPLDAATHVQSFEFQISSRTGCSAKF